jgi:hypothetical protein
MMVAFSGALYGFLHLSLLGDLVFLATCSIVVQTRTPRLQVLLLEERHGGEAPSSGLAGEIIDGGGEVLWCQGWSNFAV